MQYILILLLGFSVNLHANEKEDTLAKLANVAQNEGVKQRIGQIIKQSEKLYSPKCEDIKNLYPAAITVLETPMFDANGAPIAGHWTIRYTMDICKRKALRTIDFIADGKNIAMAALLPGNTQTDPKLQNDVSKAFKMAVSKGYKGCNKMFVADTRLLSMPKNGDAPWEELWVANVCGDLFGQVIRFVPQEDGTAFSLDIATGEK